jgi:hypothetical protein
VGDLPYSAIQETVGLPNLIADMNSQHLAFTVHDGDLKTGNGAPTCNDALYVRALGWFNSLAAPARLYARRQRLDGLRSAQQRLVLVAGTSVT